MPTQITLPKLEKTVVDAAQKELDKIDVLPIELLGEMFYPFSGIDCPVIHGIPDSSASSATTILQAMLVHFSMPENLSELPENCQNEAPMLLGYLLKQMALIGKYSELAFDCANVYKLASNKLKKGHTMLEDFKDWYV